MLPLSQSSRVQVKPRLVGFHLNDTKKGKGSSEMDMIRSTYIYMPYQVQQYNSAVLINGVSVLGGPVQETGSKAPALNKLSIQSSRGRRAMVPRQAIQMVDFRKSQMMPCRNVYQEPFIYLHHHSIPRFTTTYLMARPCLYCVYQSILGEGWLCFSLLQLFY